MSSNECEFCDLHGEKMSDLSWTTEKVRSLCHRHEEFEKEMRHEMDKRITNTAFYWIVGSVSTILFVTLLTLFGELRGMSASIYPKLSGIEVQQGKTASQVDNLKDKIADLATDQRVLLRKLNPTAEKDHSLN